METLAGLLGSVLGIALGGWLAMRHLEKKMDREFKDAMRKDK